MTQVLRMAAFVTPVVSFSSGAAWAGGGRTMDEQADLSALAQIKAVHYKDLCDKAPGKKSCFAKVVTDANGQAIRKVTPLVTPDGLGPADLQSAYNLPTTGGAGKIVAVIDAFDSPNAEADLAVYRQTYNLPPCTTANGCFKKVDQNGGTTYPAADSGWEGETMLDIDMISAACPDCHILLVETNDDQNNDGFHSALATATKLGAVAISNSYGGPEDTTIATEETFYHQPVLVTASTGDSGYGVIYPATSAFVLAVGGTSLTKSASTRGWAESAWSSGGSGCSGYVSKPTYQKDTGCNKRMTSDVSAVGDPQTGVAVYDAGAWQVVGGTSASSPIVASVFVLLGLEKAAMDFAYKNSQAFFDITSGTNGSCGDYRCTAGVGYDGPTGWGTPNGTLLAGLGPTPPPPPAPDAGPPDSGPPTTADSGSNPPPTVKPDAGVPFTPPSSADAGQSPSLSQDAGGANGETPANQLGTDPNASSGCGCSVPGSSLPLGRTTAAIALGAVAILASRRRRT